MPKVTCEISMSLDGFIAGPNDKPGNGLGDGGERLHEWVTALESWRERHNLSGGEAGRDSELLEESFKNAGAVLVGRRMFDNAEEWGDDPPFRVPVFVVTHRPREKLVKEGATTFTFVDGVEQALDQARAAAGAKDVSVGGGATVIQQLMKAGLLDELQIHLAPVFLGGGRPLFEDMGQMELECTRVIESPAVTHLRYRPRR
jgi:dihydrofolate reductase